MERHLTSQKPWVLISALFVLSGGLGLGLALAEEYASEYTPQDYTTVTLRQAREELEDLRRALSNYNLTPTELVSRVHAIASRNKRGMRRTDDPRKSENVIDVTGLEIPATQTLTK